MKISRRKILLTIILAIVLVIVFGFVVMLQNHAILEKRQSGDEMLTAEGNVMTAHSLADVPLVHIANEPKQLADGGRLCDISPTLLDLMGLDAPEEMTGHSLVK